MVEDERSCKFTWCPICENQVSEKYKDTAKLLDHIRTLHPPVPDEQRADVKQKGRFQVLKKLKSARKTSKTSVKAAHKKINKKIEKNFRKETILCPVCNVEVVPLIFAKSSRKFADCRLGAICLLGCWPLCFVPLMISRNKSVRMVCPLCAYDYGTYDVRNPREKPVIIKNVPTSIDKPEIRGKTSKMIFVSPNEEKIEENSNLKSQEIQEIQQGGSDDFEEEYDLTEEWKMSEEKFVNTEMSPDEFFDYEDKKDSTEKWRMNEEKSKMSPNESFRYASAERVERETVPEERDKCEFCLAEMEANKRDYWLSRHSQRHKTLVNRPMSKYHDDTKYSNVHSNFTNEKIPLVSTNFQHSCCLARKY